MGWPTQSKKKKQTAGKTDSARRQVPCERCPLRERKAFRPFTADELAFVKGFKTGELRAAPCPRRAARR